jgi:hypothetical protein
VPTCPLMSAETNVKGTLSLSASRITGAGTVEGSGAQIKANEGDLMHGWNTTEENGEVVIGSRREAHRLYGKKLIYYTCVQ